MNVVRAFFPKIRALLLNFEQEQGRPPPPPPSSYAPGFLKINRNNRRVEYLLQEEFAIASSLTRTIPIRKARFKINIKDSHCSKMKFLIKGFFSKCD